MVRHMATTASTRGPSSSGARISDHLIHLYLGNLDEFRVPETQWMPSDGTNSGLVIALRFPAVEREDRTWPQLCSCDDFRWHVKGRAEPLVYDIPLGGSDVQLKATHASYACRVCDTRHTPWPNQFSPFVV